MRPDAVIFDLWETLVDWRVDEARSMLERVAERVGMDPEEFHARWDTKGNTRYIGPIRPVLRSAGVAEEALEDVCAIRLDYNRGALVPREGAVETLRTLRERGVALGLITVCTEEVEQLFPETELAGLFDAEVFSNAEGLTKPDPAIYRLCCDRLGVEPERAVFVGDGANDELAGARRVGMEAILIHRPGEDPFWPEVRTWDGPRVTSIPEVLEVLELC
ncbi:MAG TPA: HAD family hydrolase [Gaiellaceae bacterium]|nr:HAD family hydrolase [Gaiellaceae bacterium]